MPPAPQPSRAPATRTGLGFAWVALNRAFGVPRDLPERRPWREVVEDRWRSHLDLLPDEPALRAAVEAELLIPHAEADGLAVRYAGLHRGAFTIVALATAGAVVLGPVAVLATLTPPFRLALLSSELALIAIIFAVTTLARRNAWHGRWLAHRARAEALRPLRLLAYAGVHAEELRAFTRRTALDDSASILARLPSPRGPFDSRYLAKLKAAAFEGPHSELGGQIAYHRGEADRMGKLDRRVRRMHLALMAGTGLVCAAVFVVTLWLGAMPRFAGAAGLAIAVLPALAAALSAIRGHADLDELAARSAATADALEQLARQGRAAATLDEVRSVLLEATDLMVAEVNEWHTLLRTRPLTVPV